MYNPSPFSERTNVVRRTPTDKLSTPGLPTDTPVGPTVPQQVLCLSNPEPIHRFNGQNLPDTLSSAHELITKQIQDLADAQSLIRGLQETLDYTNESYEHYVIDSSSELAEARVQIANLKRILQTQIQRENDVTNAAYQAYAGLDPQNASILEPLFATLGIYLPNDTGVRSQY